MKKHFLLFALLGATSLVNAQSFPNGGFETWIDYSFYEDPQYWSGMNAMSMLGASPTAVKSTDAHSGSYALKLVTSVSDIGGDGEMDTLPGIIQLGNMDMMSGTGTTGAAFTHRPDSLIGWYKLISTDNTPFQLVFTSTKWDVAAQSAETIGVANYEGNSSSNYVRFSIPITYAESVNPDSIQVYIANSAEGSGAGNQLFIDDLSFVTNNTTTGIEERSAQIRMYPNPVNTLLTIQSDQPIQRILVKDLQGKQLFEKIGTVEIYQVETSNLAAGTYFCELYFSNGSSERLKFIRQ